MKGGGGGGGGGGAWQPIYNRTITRHWRQCTEARSADQYARTCKFQMYIRGLQVPRPPCGSVSSNFAHAT